VQQLDAAHGTFDARPATHGSSLATNDSAEKQDDYSAALDELLAAGV
jgi:hypothetical protein